MKKTTLVIILLAVMIVSCLALTACHTCEFGEWEVTKQPTCTQDGSKERVCECGELEVRDIPATGHLQDGWSWHIDFDATCTTDGSRYQVCTACGETVKTESISAKGHSYTSVVTNPTCTEQGYTTHTCDNCGDSCVDTYVDAIGHSSGSNICANCGETLDSIGLEYTLSDDGTYYILSGIGTYTGTSISIPKQYNNKPVTSIGRFAFSMRTGLTSITIPDSVTTIGEYAFNCCTGLTSITIPDSVTIIGEQAFRDCSSLTSITVDANNQNYQSIDGNLYTKDGKTLIQYATGKTDTSFTIPNGVTSIDDYALYKCSSLTSIIVDSNNPNYQSIDGNLYTKDGKTLIQYAIGKTDTSFTIPNGVTSIGARAFFLCYSLTSITIPDSLTSIGKDAFHGCSGLTSITIPDSVTIIEGAFSYCTNLISVTFEDPYGWFWTNNTLNGVPVRGTSLTLTDASQNATYITDTYDNGWWYKTN